MSPFTTLSFHEQPWHIWEMSPDEFLTGMADIGMPQEMSLVGSFAADPDDPTIRTAHRDTDLPYHRDGIYTEAIAAMQAGTYVERPNVDVVGMYCLRDNELAAACTTVMSFDGSTPYTRITLRPGQALIWDNRVWHGREGPVGSRLLVRFWTTLHDRSILPAEVPTHFGDPT